MNLRVLIIAPIVASFALTSCGPSLATAQAERDRPSNMITDTQRRQRSAQRADTIEEAQTRRYVRQDQRDSATHGIDTAGDVLGGLNRVRYLGESLAR